MGRRLHPYFEVVRQLRYQWPGARQQKREESRRSPKDHELAHVVMGKLGRTTSLVMKVVPKRKVIPQVVVGQQAFSLSSDRQ